MKLCGMLPLSNTYPMGPSWDLLTPWLGMGPSSWKSRAWRGKVKQEACCHWSLTASSHPCSWKRSSLRRSKLEVLAEEAVLSYSCGVMGWVVACVSRVGRMGVICSDSIWGCGLIHLWLLSFLQSWRSR